MSKLIFIMSVIILIMSRPGLGNDFSKRAKWEIAFFPIYKVLPLQYFESELTLITEQYITQVWGTEISHYIRIVYKNYLENVHFWLPVCFSLV